MIPPLVASAAASASASASAAPSDVPPHAFHQAVLGTWGRPPDMPAWVTLGVAIVLALMVMAPGWSRLIAQLLAPHAPLSTTMSTYSRRRFLTVAAFVAAFLSLGFIDFYLRGGPRIIDATTYFLQGRALNHGKLAWLVGDPSASFRGRFLFFREPGHLAGIFPPGYPLLLAIGFRIGAPMVIGPLLAAALVGATYLLAGELFLDERRRASFHVPEAETIGRFAAMISIACATLRYQTADTMSHAASALGITLSLAFALRARRTDDGWMFALSGLALGYVAATRTVSSFALAIVIAQIASKNRRFVSSAGHVLFGAVPGIFLLLAANRASTGYWFFPAQRAYYAVADGPPGCFKYGFGASVGCLYEHGDFVTAHLTHGYGVIEALGTTMRRLRYHITDAFNFELLFIVVALLSVRVMRTSRAARSAGALVLLHMIFYVPFYFDGNYPGGGARLFADILPVEHAIAALAIAHAWPSLAFPRRALLMLSVMFLGFAIHESFDEELLANRDGGRPAYEPDLAREAGVDHGLFFLDSDAAFNLADEPETLASHGVMALRLRNDDHDRAVFDSLGHPTTHVYRFGKDKSTVEAFTPPPPQGGNWRFEAEADFPPIAQANGWTIPAWMSGSGASQERVLELTPATSSPEEMKDASAVTEIELPLPPHEPSDFGATAKGEHLADWRVEPTVLLTGNGGSGTLTIYLFKTGTNEPTSAFPTSPAAASWTWSDDLPKNQAPNAPKPTGRISRLEAKKLVDDRFDLSTERIDTFRARIVMKAAGGSVMLDKTTFLKITR
jgi:hypothetical protein